MNGKALNNAAKALYQPTKEDAEEELSEFDDDIPF